LSNCQKVLQATVLRDLERQSYLAGASEDAYMQEAGYQVFLSITEFLRRNRLKPKVIYLICGKGNNAGDAYIAATHFLAKSIPVVAYSLFPEKDLSSLTKKYQQNFLEEGGEVEDRLEAFEACLKEKSILIDGVLGTGIKGKLDSSLSSFFSRINSLNLRVMAVDVPSGLNADTGEASENTLRASLTITLGVAKKGFFLREAKAFLGQLEVRGFGLSSQILEGGKQDFNLINLSHAKQLLPEINELRHKYQAGLVLNFSGSKSMGGAALLSSFAALRGGAGIVKLYYPLEIAAELNSSPWEIIKIAYEIDQIPDILANLKKTGCILCGPGIDNFSDRKLLLSQLFNLSNASLVIDAGALEFFYSIERKTKNIVLTPHLGELRLLIKRDTSVVTEDLIESCQTFVEEQQVCLVVKGAVNYIFSPGEIPAVCQNGVAGMATAGTGDVLAGLIASFISQGLTCFDAAKLAVFFHGLSGSIAGRKNTDYAMIASDIIKAFPKAFYLLQS
jgi:ADP-dependent NAD(P)H-hydrate dehydratase / NAD(P)H-hydrate epimerase